MKKLFILILALLTFGLLLSEGYQLYKERTKKIITVDVLEPERSILHIPMYIALKENFFDDYNLKINFKTCSQEDFDTALENNQADIVLGETVQCLFTKPCEVRNNWLCFAAVTNRCGYFLLAHESIPDFEWENIKGKTVIAGPPENSGELVLESTAREKGLLPQHDFIILWNIPDNLKVGAFKAETGSYILLKEPAVTGVESKKQAVIVSSLGNEGGELPEVVFSARKDFIEKNSEAIQGFSNSIYKAQIWIKYHNAREIAEKVKKYFPNLDKMTLEKSIKRYLEQNTWCLTPEVPQAPYEHFQEITRQCGELYCSVDFSDQVNNSFAKESTASVEYIPEDKQEKKFPQDFLRVLFK